MYINSDHKLGRILVFLTVPFIYFWQNIRKFVKNFPEYPNSASLYRQIAQDYQKDAKKQRLFKVFYFFVFLSGIGMGRSFFTAKGETNFVGVIVGIFTLYILVILAHLGKWYFEKKMREHNPSDGPIYYWIDLAYVIFPYLRDMWIFAMVVFVLLNLFG